jgi:UDP-glucose 4-epimerase
LIKAFETATGIKIPYKIEGRRPGDIDANYANCDKAYRELGWKARLSIIDACRDAYLFQKKNPEGIK